MWNVNFRRGTIWEVKSINECDKDYYGVGFNNHLILMLSVFTDESGKQKYTYLTIDDRKTFKYKTYIDIDMKNCIKYVEIDRLLTGEILSLKRYICDIQNVDLDKILNSLKIQFNIFRPRQKEMDMVTIIKNTKQKPKLTSIPDNNQQKLYKFGIEIFVTPNEDVTITKSKKLTLSDKAKLDIINNSQTESDLAILCEKYQIYPIKAIREIRNRLVYQFKQK